MSERNLPSHRIHELFLVLGVAGFVLGMGTASSDLRLSHLAGQIPVTHSAILGAEVSSAKREDRLTERMRQTDGMRSMPRVRTATSAQALHEHACATPTNPDRDWRVILAMMAIQQRRIAREHALTELPLFALTKHSVAPPNAVRWARNQQRDPVC
jgi:hypothetical protein